jgi:hypothetical protein
MNQMLIIFGSQAVTDLLCYLKESGFDYVILI